MHTKGSHYKAGATDQQSQSHRRDRPSHTYKRNNLSYTGGRRRRKEEDEGGGGMRRKRRQERTCKSHLRDRRQLEDKTGIIACMEIFNLNKIYNYLYLGI